MSKRVYVLDTTALIYYKCFEGKNVTVRSALDEVRDEYEKIVVRGLSEGGVIEVMTPPEDYVKQALKISKETGDYPVLSKTDLELIALAIYLRDMMYEVVVVTDDYAIQNILRRLNIPYHALIREIRCTTTWKLVCSRCGKEYPADAGDKITECIICGGEIIRKRVKGTS